MITEKPWRSAAQTNRASRFRSVMNRRAASPPVAHILTLPTNNPKNDLPHSHNSTQFDARTKPSLARPTVLPRVPRTNWVDNRINSCRLGLAPPHFRNVLSAIARRRHPPARRSRAVFSSAACLLLIALTSFFLWEDASLPLQPSRLILPPTGSR